MESEQLRFLQTLVESAGVAGYEEAPARVFRDHLRHPDVQIQTDVMGSVTASLNPGGRPCFLLDSHADEIGFLVKYIDDKGFLYVGAAGGWDAEVAVAQRVRVHTAQGAIPGVFGKRAIHLMDADERKKKSELDQMWVDIGAKDKAQAQEWVEIGDFVTIDAGLIRYPNDLAVSKAFDNRAGMFVVAETLKALVGTSVKAAVHSVAAVQEEIGLRGARTAAYRIDPQVAIAIDVCHAVDFPDGSKKKSSETRLGGGPAICRGANINPKLFRRLVELARSHDIPYQVIASPGGTGTNANPIQLTRSGVATGLVAIPLRYMHSPCEMLHLDDLTAAVELLKQFALSLDESDNWIPGE